MVRVVVVLAVLFGPLAAQDGFVTAVTQARTALTARAGSSLGADTRSVWHQIAFPRQ